MRLIPRRHAAAFVSALFLGVGLPATASPARSQDQLAREAASTSQAESQQRDGVRLGFEAFGGVAASWPLAQDSYEAVGLDSVPIEFGGGARIAGIWRRLFAQVAISRWTDDGERAFVDSAGNRFPLGIPLKVEATFIDVGAGWRTEVRSRGGRTVLLPYVAAGMGVALYSESSPFAESGDDFEKGSASYHVLGGVEIPLLKWLALAVDGRFRYVPDLLGDGGVSGALGEGALGGVQVALGLRVGSPGRSARTAAAQPEVQPPPTPAAKSAPLPMRPDSGMLIEDAPAYLLPDPTRVPLRTLRRGTTVRILEETGDWVLVEFEDPQYGPRVGYVLRKFVRFNK